jgi:hypothetical protein
LAKKQHQPDTPPRKHDQELEQFRTLMQPPETFEDGFSWVAFLGAIFVALLMVPGSIYMTLIAGVAVGPAAQWVTLILFIEVARRANKSLKRAEIFTLFYLAGAIMTTASMAQGQFHGGLGVLWAQFYVQSEAAAAAGVADGVPFWVAPDDQTVLNNRSLLQWQWLPAIGLAAFTMIIGRLDNMILGYGLFRLTSDIERLPFPLAPIQAQGILALSEEQEEENSKKSTDEPEEDDTGMPGEEKAENWRWRVFSIGAIIGLIFGAVYLGLPVITGALLDQPIAILPIPFIDFTQQTANILPAVAMAVSLNLGQVIMGMVFPFWAVVGTFLGFVITAVANPVLYGGFPDAIPVLGRFDGGILTSWNAGDPMQVTFYKNQIDFYFSFSIGVALAIAVMGFWSVGKALMKMKQKRQQMDEDDHQMYAVPEGRGDIKWWVITAVYLISSFLYIGVSALLLHVTDDGGLSWQRHGGVMIVMLIYAFIYTPLISYVTARLEGIAGEVLSIPFVREAAYILSGYQGVAVWFLPVPYHNYGQMTVFYRSCELTGTKFWSIWKSELLLTPIILLGSLAFAHFVWQLGPIPGPNYPYAQEMWELHAAQQSVAFSSTLGGYTVFEQALDGWYILSGSVLGLICFVGLGWLGAPTFLMYGVVKGLNQTLPFMVFGQFAGALIGRYYFQKRLGLQWRQYIPVVAAGFSCGMGLIGTLGIGFTFLAKSVFQLPY